MATFLPRDADDNPIEVLGFLDGGAKSVSFTTSAVRSSSAFDTNTRIIAVYATQACFIKLGNDSVTATTSDHFIPASTRILISIGGGKSGDQATHLSAIRVSADGIIYISELK